MPRSSDVERPLPCGRGSAALLMYFLTFACYGQHLHGSPSGSVDRGHNVFGSPVLADAPVRASRARAVMKQTAYLLDRESGTVVLHAIVDTCSHAGWKLLAAHIRTTHAHVVMEAEVRPEKIMNAFKAYASPYLKAAEREQADVRRWAHHGSTRWLCSDVDVRSAIRYVVEEQGSPMVVFVAEEYALARR